MTPVYDSLYDVRFDPKYITAVIRPFYEHSETELILDDPLGRKIIRIDQPILDVIGELLEITRLDLGFTATIIA